MLPLPGTPASTWAMYRARLAAVFADADPRVCLAFWLFGKYLRHPHLPRPSKADNPHGNLTFRPLRSHQQCSLRRHPLRRSRSRRSIRAQSGRPLV